MTGRSSEGAVGEVLFEEEVDGGGEFGVVDLDRDADKDVDGIVVPC